MGHAACNAESYSWMLSKVKEWFNDWDSLQVHVSMENHEMHRLMMKQEAQTIGGRRGRFTMDAIAFSADQVSLTHKSMRKLNLSKRYLFSKEASSQPWTTCCPTIPSYNAILTSEVRFQLARTNSAD